MKRYDIDATSDSLYNIRKIAKEICGAKGVEIHLPDAIYHWIDNNAVADFNALMCGKLDYDTHWGRPDIPYNKAVVFENVEDLHIIGNNTRVYMHGLIAPFTFLHCKNVQMEGITIDWERPPFTPCRIVDVDGEKITLEVFDDFKLEGGEPIWAIMEYDTKRKRIGSPWKFRVQDVIHKEADGTIWFKTKTCDGILQAGNHLIVRHIGNYRPVIHLYGGEGFRFSHMTLHAGAGMGIVAHLTKNIALRDFNVRPYKDRMMSTNTDATHFISCMGMIDVENCYFEGMGDDAINVHGFYNSITKIVDPYTVAVTILNPNGTQDMIYDAPAEGNIVEFAQHDVLIPFAYGKVAYTQINNEEWSAVLRFEEPLPKAVKEGDLLADATHVPTMRFVNCHVNSIRARAALIQTRNALVENCLIENCTGTGIHVDTATGWYESIGTRNVIIRNNVIRNCGYGDATYNETTGIAVTTECPENAIGVHKHLQITRNRIDCSGKNGIFVSCTDDVKICENIITDCSTAILFECCDRINVCKNETDGKIMIQNGTFGFDELGI